MEHTSNHEHEVTERAPMYTSEDKNVLHSVMKTVGMALKSLEYLTEELKDRRDIVQYLVDQIDAYKEIGVRANEAFKLIGDEPETVGGFSKAMLFGSIKMNMVANDSDSHIADMMIQGTNMGIIEIQKTLNELQEQISEPCRKLVYDILFAMNAFVEDMKEFL